MAAEPVSPKRNRTPLIVAAVVGVLVICVCLVAIALGGYFIINRSSSTPAAQRRATSTRALSEPSPATLQVCNNVRTIAGQGAEHIRPGQTHPAYNSNPPTSGWHWAEPQDWGIYSTPQVQEQLVHNLEHGGIIIQYNNLPPDQLQRLIDLVGNDDHHILLAPYPRLPSGVTVALTAWQHLQTCTGVDEDAILKFIEAFRDKGPEQVP